ncbi:MAG TPA: class I SAM-dependent rRNA methyltransferase [Pyrinomonadaceae bacterium]|jgi:23S rRNA (cytosine1962-C5)-methyltransferase|nr:class I SAM-dependent rRNA methyltransferase [Pyrinomonadaceae bacterium]
MATIKISRRGAKRVRQGHLWVYRSDVGDTGEADAGAIVEVVDEASNFVGQAFYSDASEITLRFLTTGREPIDRDWWRNRLRNCAARRASIKRETNAYRLVYSEGDLLPSIIVDVYDGHYVLQTLSQGSDRIQPQLVELLIEEFDPNSIIELNDARVRQLEGLELRKGLIWSAPAERSVDGALDQFEINQHGVHFIVSPLAGQKTGAFLDQRENYLAAQRVAHGRALDCFTFNGGFALHIAKACDSVLGIDISSDAVAAAQRNAALNEVTNVTFQTANVFDALREMESARERFDTIVLDPPAFTKSRANVKSGARGYKEINLRALKLLNPGGVLITCTCSYHLSEEMFLEIIANAALDAHRRVQIIEQRGQSTDHPVLLGVPETHYLKCVIARVIE